MKYKLVQFLIWLLHKLNVSQSELLPLYGITDILTVPSAVRTLTNSAKLACVTEEAKHQNQSGEYKRHQVLAYLLKRYPESPQSDIAFAIELALIELKRS